MKTIDFSCLNFELRIALGFWLKYGLTLKKMM